MFVQIYFWLFVIVHLQNGCKTVYLDIRSISPVIKQKDNRRISHYNKLMHYTDSAIIELRDSYACHLSKKCVTMVN